MTTQQVSEAVQGWTTGLKTPIAYNYLPNREVVLANYLLIEVNKIKHIRTMHDETVFAPFSHPSNSKVPPATRNAL
jgi:hypothetical protein